MKLALRIVVASARGARDHALRLVDLLARREAGATFYVNLGPHRRARWLPGREVGGRAAEALMRIRDAWPPASLDLFQKSLRDYRSEKFTVDTVTLFSSALNPKGAVHTALKTFTLQ